MKFYIGLLLSFFLMTMSVSARGESVSTLADSAYSKGEYKEAISLYEKILQEQGVSSSLLYNLGNSYMQDGDLAKAMICYQRARKLDPSSKLINGNLSYLKNKVEDSNRAEQQGKRLKVTEDEKSFLETAHQKIASDTSSDAWAVWSLIFFILFLSGVCMYLFSGRVAIRKTGFFGGFIMICLSVITIIFAFISAGEYENNDIGVITAYKVILQTEPGSKNEKGNILTRGSVVKVVSEETDADGNVTWFKIRLNGDYIGWVPSEDLEVI